MFLRQTALGCCFGCSRWGDGDRCGVQLKHPDARQQYKKQRPQDFTCGRLIVHGIKISDRFSGY